MPQPPIIDSHIHLYPASDLSDLSWCPPSHPLHKTHSPSDFRASTSSSPSLQGYIFIESDRAHNDEPSGWPGPLREVAYLRSLIEADHSTPSPPSPSSSSPSSSSPYPSPDAAPPPPCLAIIPWAPIDKGPEVLERYLDALREQAGDRAWSLVKGFRHLLQDKPHGTMLAEPFIASLRLLGRRGFVFEVAVDQHRRGKRQLEETLEMIARAHEGVPDDERVTFILNHLCKPDLSIYNIHSDPSYNAWRTNIYALGKCSKTYIKLSGLFSEMNPDEPPRLDPSDLFQALLPWLGVLLATFGPRRIIFASDWPVCTIGFDDPHLAWPRWRDLVDKMCWMASLEDDDKAMIFAGTAKEAYKI